MMERAENSGVGSGLWEGMCGCSTGWVCWVLSVLWLCPCGSAGTGMLPCQELTGRAGDISGGARAAQRDGEGIRPLCFTALAVHPLQGWADPTDPSLSLFLLYLSPWKQHLLCVEGLGHGYRTAVLGHPTPNEPYFWPFSFQKPSNPFHDFCVTIYFCCKGGGNRKL